MVHIILWIVAIGIWVLFFGTVIRNHFRIEADKREALRRDIEFYKKRAKL